MIDEKFALLRTHRNNIMRYRRLLNTKLTECERQFIERRLSEERSAMEKLAASTFPLAFQIPAKSTETPAPETAVAIGMPYKFTVFEVVLEKSDRKRWRWRVSTTDGRAIMLGSERNRPAAKYCADRALFQLLLAAPYLDASAIARSSFETSAPHGWVGRRRGNDKPKH